MIITRLPMRNETGAKLTVHVEPWGEEHELSQGESLEVVLYGPAGGKPEIVVGHSDISVFAWEGCRLFVLRNNVSTCQPSLLKIIDRLCAAEGVDRSKLNLEPEGVEFAQSWLDSAAAWDREGENAAIEAVARLAPALDNLGSEGLLWKFCQIVLHSRGLFLHADTDRFHEFLTALRQNPNDLARLLAAWREATVNRPLVDGTMMLE
jgi:hypothetical protein